jgi:hypothetical protein
MQSKLPTPVVAAIITVVVLVAGFFLYRTFTGASSQMSNPDDPRIQGKMPSRADAEKLRGTGFGGTKANSGN